MRAWNVSWPRKPPADPDLFVGVDDDREGLVPAIAQILQQGESVQHDRDAALFGRDRRAGESRLGRLVELTVRYWPFTVSHCGAVQARVPPNNGLQDDGPRAARA